MQHITDDMVDAAITPAQAQTVLLEAFRSFGEGRAAMQERIRTDAGGVKLSTLGAVIPDQKVTGAKVYTTIKGQFNFVILLFSCETGEPLASFEANAITRLRTAACSVIAARQLARSDARVMALYGAGTQGQAHAVQFSQAFPLKEIRVCDPAATESLAADLSRRCGTEVRLAAADQAVRGADLVVTASRSTTPLFDGALLEPGCFVAAVGSSLPHTRELDDRALTRASRLVVEWLPQSSREAGDIVLADPAALPTEKLIELGALLTGRAIGRRSPDDILIYKTVGVGLQDIALAGFAWQQMAR